MMISMMVIVDVKITITTNLVMRTIMMIVVVVTTTTNLIRMI